MKGKKLLTAVALSAVLFAGCGLKQEAVIKVNDQIITKAQFDKTFDEQVKNSPFARMGINIKDDENGFMYLMVKERVTNELIIRALLDAEMAKRGIEVSKDDVNEAVKEIIEKVGSKEQLSAILKQNGVSNAQFRKDLAEEVKMKKLAKELGSSEVSEKETKDYYNKNIAKFKYPEKVRASHILISAIPEEIEEIIVSDPKNKELTPEQVKVKVNEEMKARKAKADELLNKAKADVNGFAALAKDNSDDAASAVKGGDLGFFAHAEMVPEFSNAAFKLRPNTISAVVKSKFGYHIILVTDRMAAGQQPYEKVKEDIKNYLSNQKQLKLLDNLVESLKKNAKIEYLSNDYNPNNIQDKLNKELKRQTDNVKNGVIPEQIKK